MPDPGVMVIGYEALPERSPLVAPLKFTALPAAYSVSVPANPDALNEN